nr:hypothetical protein [uncultured Pedobacter sp.]
MRKKKDLPLIILQALEPFVIQKGEKFEVVDPGKSLLKVVDKEPGSNFHFTIELHEKKSDGTYQLLMSTAPTSSMDNADCRAWIKIDSINKQFSNWIEMLDKYDNIKSFFDDKIVNGFQQEFYAEFEVLEEEEDFPLKTKQILLLDEYLEELGGKLQEYVNEQNINEISTIQDEIILLRENLTTKSKEWVLKNLTKIWGSVAKQGTKFIKELLTESKKELIKQGIKATVDYIVQNGPHLLS